MEISGFRSEEELIELLDAGKITVLTFVTHQSKELSEEEYRRIYDDFLRKYDVISNVERPLSVEGESAD